MMLLRKCKLRSSVAYTSKWRPQENRKKGQSHQKKHVTGTWGLMGRRYKYVRSQVAGYPLQDKKQIQRCWIAADRNIQLPRNFGSRSVRFRSDIK